ncbi:hypothetical protein, partial [Pseudomonas yangonensis]|uniref:hypothetical protein n=1 Tax=Pseudomonas yangonensis TaxID=2579922 RepID=UPI0015B6407B
IGRQIDTLLALALAATQVCYYQPFVLHQRIGFSELRGAQGGVQRARQLAKQFPGLLRGRPENQAVNDPEHPRWPGCPLAFAYPDRL